MSTKYPINIEHTTKQNRKVKACRANLNRADSTIERQGQMIVKQAEQIQRMEDNMLKLIGNLQQAVEALLEIADYADKEPFDMRDLKLIAIASDCLGVK